MKILKRNTGFSVILLGVLSAVSAFKVAHAATYDLYQNGQKVGTSAVTWKRLPNGQQRSTSSTSIPGFLDLHDHLTLGKNGRPVHYRVDGKERGVRFQTSVTFTSDKIKQIAKQQGRKQTSTFPAKGQVYLIDNNLFDGWRPLLRQLHYKAGNKITVAFLLPQNATMGSLSIAIGVTKWEKIAGQTRQVRTVNVKMKVAGHTIPQHLLVDAHTHELLELTQPQGKVRVVLRSQGKSSRAKSNASNKVNRVLADKLAQEHRCLTQKTVHVASTGATLYGKITVPVKDEQAPGILLIPGSGPVDLNGNEAPVLHDDMYKQLAFYLGCHGYAMLRYDKLGLKPSTGKGNDVTPAIYKQNIIDLLHALAKTSNVDAHALILMGHSEGGLLALFTAPAIQKRLRAVVLLESPGKPLGEILKGQVLREAQARDSGHRRLQELKTKMITLVEAIRHSKGKRLDLKPPLDQFPLAQAFAPAAGYLRDLMRLKPTCLIAKIHRPILIVQGGTDVQVDAVNGERLQRAQPRAKLLFLPHLTHVLHAQDDAAGDVHAATALLDPVLLRGLTAWLNRHV